MHGADGQATDRVRVGEVDALATHALREDEQLLVLLGLLLRVDLRLQCLEEVLAGLHGIEESAAHEVDAGQVSTPTAEEAALHPELRIGDVDAVVAQTGDELEDGLLAIDLLCGSLAGFSVGCGRSQACDLRSGA